MPSDVSGANVNLSALTIGSISLDPTFAAGTTAYTAETSNATNAITATAAINSGQFSIKNSIIQLPPNYYFPI